MRWAPGWVWSVLIPPLVFSLQAQPGPTYVACLDTMAVNSRVVSVVEITDLCSSASCNPDNNVVVTVDEHLKGDEHFEGDRFQFRIDAPAAALADWKTRVSHLLVFAHLADDPSWGYHQESKVIDLSARDLKVLTGDMSILRDLETVLQGTRNAISRHPNVYGMITVSRSIRADIAKEFGAWVWSKTTVPADADLEQWALASFGFEPGRGTLGGGQCSGVLSVGSQRGAA